MQKQRIAILSSEYPVTLVSTRLAKSRLEKLSSFVLQAFARQRLDERIRGPICPSLLDERGFNRLCINDDKIITSQTTRNVRIPLLKQRAQAR